MCLDFWTESHILPRCPVRELNLQKGDIVYIHRQVDANWFEGEHHGRAGIFPTTYVEVRFVSSRRLSAAASRTVLLSSPCPLQILPPTEKPTPIRSPTLQVLDYGEAVALYNFTGDLPVELSFRKVSDAKNDQKRWRKRRQLSEPSWNICGCSLWCDKNPFSKQHINIPSRRDEIEIDPMTVY